MFSSALWAARGAYFVVGGVVGATLASSPTVRNGARTLARQAIKGGLILKAEMAQLAEKAREDWQDLVAEAQAELDGQKTAGAEPGHVHTADCGHKHEHGA